MMVTYTWAVDRSSPPLAPELRAFVHFVGPDGGIVFTDDHAPDPPVGSWKPGQSYTYRRAVLVPVRSFVGALEVRVGLFHPSGGGRIALKGTDRGLQEYAVGSLRVQAPDVRWRVEYGEGWYEAEAPAADPFAEQRWMGRAAIASFRNRKRDVLVMLKGATNMKGVPADASMRVSIGDTAATITVNRPGREEWRFLFPAAALGDGRWADLKLEMSHTFVPRDVEGGADARELGFLVHGLYVGPADEVSPLLRAGIVTPTTQSPAQRPAPAGTRP
jgi:hypothetical protein